MIQFVTKNVIDQYLTWLTVVFYAQFRCVVEDEAVDLVVVYCIRIRSLNLSCCVFQNLDGV